MATQTVIANEVKEDLCQYCKDAYEDPRILPCLHSFCSKCITEFQILESRCVTCPTCNETSQMKTLGEGDMANFPVNICLGEEKERNKLIKKFELSPSSRCDSCEDSPTPSVAYCTDCGDYLCQECWGIHRKIKATRLHITFSLEDLRTKEKTELLKILRPANRDYPSLQCSRHPDVKVDYYCTQCSVSMCAGCIVKAHKGHKVMKLQEWVTSKKLKIATDVTELAQRKQKVGDAVKIVKNAKERVSKSRQESEEAIVKLFTKIRQIIDQEQEKALTSLNSIATAKETCLSMQLEQLQKLFESMAHCQTMADTAVSEYSESHMLFIADLLLSRADILNGQYSSTSLGACEVPEITVTERSEDAINALASLVTVADHNTVALNTTAVLPHTLGVNLQTKIIVTTQSTKAPQPVKCAFEPMGSYGGALTCPVANSGDGTYTASVQPTHSGMHHLSITIGGQHIQGSPYVINVVAKRDYSTINVSAPVKAFRNIVKPSCVAFSEDDETLFVTTSSPGTIRVYERLQEDKMYSINSVDGEPLQCPHGIDVKGEVVYVAEFGAHRITRITKKGELLDRFGEHGTDIGQFDRLWNVKVGPNGKIYVSDTYNDRIQVFNPDFTISHVIDGRNISIGNRQSLKGPTGIIFDMSGNLHVAWCASNVVTVSPPQGSRIIRHYDVVSAPAGLAVDLFGYSVVNSYKTGGISVYDPAGNLVKSITTSTGGYGAAMSSSGQICVTKFKKNEILFY